PQRMRGGIRIAHEKPPRRPELSVHVGARLEVVFAQTRDERVDAVAALRIVGPFALAGDEARVIDEEIHIGIALGDAADIDASRVRVRLRSERQALVNRDVANSELARLLDRSEEHTSEL